MTARSVADTFHTESPASLLQGRKYCFDDLPVFGVLGGTRKQGRRVAEFARKLTRQDVEPETEFSFAATAVAPA